MFRTLPRQLLAGLVVGFFPSLAPAQPLTQEVRFETVDRVDLKGTFYPSKGGNKSPCVLLLHELGGNRTQNGWDELAKALQAAGFAVLSFDFRGHGDSTTVNPEVFWQLPINARTFKVGKDSKDRISSADFLKKNPAYTPMLVNDIEAAKNQLNMRNNLNDCNASNTIVIGAEDGAVLGSLWAWSQFKKPRFVPNPLTNGFMPDPLKTEGNDIAACVWLSIPSTLNKIPVSRWLAGTQAPIPEKVPTAFFHGDKDVNSAKAAAALLSAFKTGHRINEATKLRPVKNSKAVGHELLKGSLGTTKEITDFLQKSAIEKRGNVTWEKRPQLPLQLIPLAPYFSMQ